MSDNLKKQLAKARPSLRLAAPVSFWFIGLMGIFNIILGALLYYYFNGGVDDRALGVITAIIPIGVWSLAFILLGIAKIAALYKNSWIWARRTLLVGVGMKSGWALALIWKSVYQPDNVFLTMLWITLAIVQFMCYVFFLPPHVIKPKGK